VGVHPQASAALVAAVVLVVVAHVERLMHGVASAVVAGVGTLATMRAE
jgi:hypothetical protein